MLRLTLLTCLTVMGGLSPSFAQGGDRSGVLPPNNRFCLVQRETNAVNCMFATMKQCLESANVGREGECITNPALSTPGFDPRRQR